MKPNPSELAVTGSLPVPGRRMSFDENSLAHIMRLLIDLYSDSERAIIRELSTNALDSHVMAGVKRPIEVTTPSPLTPFFIVKDYGLGLSVDEIYNLFGKYGASTKRDTNEATGMLGLGSKSPLTYTNQFTMTAIKDGIRAIVSISRDEDGVGNLTVVDTAATSDSNGVEIKIPAKTGNVIERKAKEFFKVWRAGTVLLNGNEPARIEDGIQITPDITLLPRQSGYNTDESVVVMGNVSYPAPDLSAQNLGVPYGYSIVAYVPIGAVDFAPSREALQMTPKTRKAIETIKHDFRQGLIAAVQHEVETASTGWDAIKVMHNWASVLGHNRPDSFTWRGKTLPTRIKAPVTGLSTNGNIFVVSAYDTRRSKVGNLTAIALDYIVEGMFIENFDGAAVTPTMRRKLSQWWTRECASNLAGVAVQRFIFMDFALPERELIDPKRIVDWSVIKAEKLPKNQPLASGRIPGSFDVFDGGKANQNVASWRRGVPGDKLDYTKPIYYLHGNVYEASAAAKVLDHFVQEYTIICLPENRIPKFTRENPKVQSTDVVIKQFAEALVKAQTPQERLALAQHDASDRSAAALLAPHVSKLLDPELQKAARLSQIDISGIVASRKRFWHEFKWPEEKWDNPLDKYPLFDTYNMQMQPDHVIRYLNAEYKHLNGGNA